MELLLDGSALLQMSVLSEVHVLSMFCHSF